MPATMSILTITASRRLLERMARFVEDLCMQKWTPTMKANSCANIEHFLIFISNTNKTFKDKVRCMHSQHRNIIEVIVFVTAQHRLCWRLSLTIGGSARCGIGLSSRQTEETRLDMKLYKKWKRASKRSEKREKRCIIHQLIG